MNSREIDLYIKELESTSDLTDLWDSTFDLLITINTKELIELELGNNIKTISSYSIMDIKGEPPTEFVLLLLLNIVLRNNLEIIQIPSTRQYN